MLKSGECLDGYRLIRLIGSGGFGEVWLCQSEALGDLRALKFIPSTSGGQIQKEFEALSRYRTAAGQLRSPSIMPIEHANITSAGLFYIMPLADGRGASDPVDPAWVPLTLATHLQESKGAPAWLPSYEIKAIITSILQALQLLSDVGLVHRDVKPENILYLSGVPCLGDISLLGEDSFNITRRGTPGYSAPSWFVESGGQPDMFGAATTLYTVLTGNPPDKMGRAAHRWPPQGEGSLSDKEKNEWLKLHQAIRRAVDERPAERFSDFHAFSRSLEFGVGVDTPISKSSLRLLVVAVTTLVVTIVVWEVASQRTKASLKQKPSAEFATSSVGSSSESLFDSKSTNIPKKYHQGINELKAEITKLRKILLSPSYPSERITGPVDEAVKGLTKISTNSQLSLEDTVQQLVVIKSKLEKALEYAPMRAGQLQIELTIEHLYEKAANIKILVQSDEEKRQYDQTVQPLVEGEIKKLESDLNTEWRFRDVQTKKVHKAAMLIVERFEAPDPSAKGRTYEGIVNDPNRDFRKMFWESVNAMTSNVGKLGMLKGDILVYHLIL